MTLNDITSPDDIRGLSNDKLKTLAFEIRKFLVSSISETGGHLASNLGVVELTLALHSVFDFSKDRLVWDVGHQAYVHKILTGRKNQFETLRQFGGISGFPKTSESIYDSFNTGHASTSASAALGMARARDLSGDNYDVVAVFGDGALTGGMLFEALNDAGHSKSKVIFILNDNEMSIAHNVGAISKYLQKLRHTKGYFKSKDAIEELLGKLPVGADATKEAAKKVKKLLRIKVLPPTLFDNLGFNYLGPVNGHDIETLKIVFERAKALKTSSFIHIQTKKGKGYRPAELNPQQYHGISGGTQKKISASYSEAFGKELCALAEKDKKIVAITGAMPDGTGLAEFAVKFKDRYFDVGIAEQHAVTMAAGLATRGYIPVVPLYSTFMQRSYDQILHDVCLQNLHVVLCADRAGIVGNDGETHHGLYDIAFLSHIPNMSILSPSSFRELSEMLDYAVNVHNGPIAIRYPRGSTQLETVPFTFGKANLLREGKDILIVSTGRMLKTAMAIAQELDTALLAVPTLKPFDGACVCENTKNKRLVVTIEDAAKAGGIGSLTAIALSESGVGVPLLRCGFPDTPVTQGKINELDKYYKLDTESIVEQIKEKINV